MANTKKYVSLDKLSLYDEKIKKLITDSDAAALKSAKDYADGLASNYDAAGTAATAAAGALADAKVYADNAANAKDAAIAAAKKAGDDAAAAAAVADGKAVAAQGEVDALEAYVGTFTHDTAKSVVEYINAKTDGIATSGNLEALAGRVTTVEGKVATIEGDYLKGSDKTELEGKINAKADQTALDGVSAVANAAVKQSDYDVKVKALEDEDTRIEGLVTAEAERAAGAEGALDERLAEVEAFFKLAEGEQLDTALDTLKEIQTYITSEGSAADQMVLDIAANAKAIEDMDAAYKAADTTINGRLDVLEAIDHDAYVDADTALKNELNGEIAKKADSSALTSAVEALEGADSAMAGRLDTLEAKFTGEGSVEDMIGDAKQEAIDAAAADATSKANTAEANAKAEAVRLDGLMNTRVEALEAIDHDHSNKDELDLIASGDKAKWDAAAAKAHEHGNKTVLDGITAENITTWNTVTSKAAQADLTAVGDRVTAIETWHANFVEVSEEEINALFATNA